MIVIEMTRCYLSTLDSDIIVLLRKEISVHGNTYHPLRHKCYQKILEA